PVPHRHARARPQGDGGARPMQGLARLYARGGMTDAPTRGPASPAVAGIDRAPFEEFLIHEARLLDERRFREWMELFADDGTYWVPAAPDQASPFDRASLFYDDRELMKTRVERLEHPRIHVQTPPSRTAHLGGNVRVEQADETKGEYVIGSTVIIWSSIATRRSASSLAGSAIGCAATERACASLRSGSTSLTAIAPSRRSPCRFRTRSCEREERRTRSAPSPLVGEGWGGGGACGKRGAQSRDPHPQPLPTRGRGAQPVRGLTMFQAQITMGGAARLDERFARGRGRRAGRIARGSSARPATR